MLAITSGWQLTYILLIVGDPQGILDQQLRPCPIHLLNIIIALMEEHVLDTNAGKQLS